MQGRIIARRSNLPGKVFHAGRQAGRKLEIGLSPFLREQALVREEVGWQAVGRVGEVGERRVSHDLSQLDGRAVGFIHGVPVDGGECGAAHGQESREREKGLGAHGFEDDALLDPLYLVKTVAGEHVHEVGEVPGAHGGLLQAGVNGLPFPPVIVLIGEAAPVEVVLPAEGVSVLVPKLHVHDGRFVAKNAADLPQPDVLGKAGETHQQAPRVKAEETGLQARRDEEESAVTQPCNQHDREDHPVEPL